MPPSSPSGRQGDADPADSREPTARAAHLHPGLVLLVAAGGTLGTAARAGLSLAVPEIGGFPVAILMINLSGAFLLGLLLEVLVRRGPDVGARRRMRLFAGTGVCGGFTTYSALASATALLLDASAPGPAVLYAVGTVVVGGVATWAGIVLGTIGARARARA